MNHEVTKTPGKTISDELNESERQVVEK